ncbi:coilin [Seriola lalandi dorsalis]|uniref:Coilin p80 n=1 Tax=Seriola lalandi dorsalis TaxID=1841481 RepID=A0A3B4XFY6_SERLL|nr:coilin [Seriola lalandi dorsalis]
MAANSNNCIRVRLHFDYPPPAVVDCRMCWLLVDLNKCRVVADLESVVREKFEFSSRSILNLFIEDCYLPHTESIFVVRDNDSVRVKVDSVVQVNGHSSSCSDTSSKNCRKRQRPTEEDGPEGNGVSVQWKEKKRKKHSKESLEGDGKLSSGEETNKTSQGKHTKKKRKKAEETAAPAAPPKPAVSNKKTPTSVTQPVKSTKKPPAAPAKTHSVSSSDSSSSSSEEDKAPKKPPVRKPAPKTPSSTPAASKAPPHTKPTQTKSHPPSSSSSETDSSSDEAPNVKIPPKNKPLTSASPKSRINDNSKSHQAPPVLQSTNCAEKQATSTATPPDDKSAEPGNSDSEEIELVIRKPLQQSGRGLGRQPSWRGCSQRGPRRGGPGDRGRGRGRGFIRGQADSFEFSYNGAKEPSYQTDSLTNTSVVIQNGAESAPKQDYSSMPLLAAPPQVGQKIAFKLLELGENYTPEISEYKEGKIVSFDPTSKQIELELLHVSQAPVGPGKFDLVYQDADGSERVEYAVSRGAWVTERWDSLLEPRLVI